MLITAIGVSYFLQNVALLIYGANTKSFTSVVTIPALKLMDGKLVISGETIVTVLACLIIMAGLMTFMKYSKSGQRHAGSIRGQRRRAADGRQCQRDHCPDLRDRFCPGGHRRRAAMCSSYPALTPYTGSMPGIKAFVAAVFGGIGSIPGAFIGGILLGVIEILSKAYISSQLADAIVFAVLIVVLLVKPTGLLGKQIQEKV